jgi:hypothetical protein
MAESRGRANRKYTTFFAQDPRTDDVPVDRNPISELLHPRAGQRWELRMVWIRPAMLSEQQCDESWYRAASSLSVLVLTSLQSIVRFSRHRGDEQEAAATAVKVRPGCIRSASKACRIPRIPCQGM